VTDRQTDDDNRDNTRPLLKYGRLKTSYVVAVEKASCIVCIVWHYTTVRSL